MRIEDQVCSLELSKKLKELWVKQDSLFWWNGNREWIRTYDPKKRTDMHDGSPNAWVKDSQLTWDLGRVKSESPSCEQSFSAFTVAELGEILPYFIFMKADEMCYECDTVLQKDKDQNPIWNAWKGHDFYAFGYKGTDVSVSKTAATEADARAKLLIYLLENKLIKLT